MASSLASQLSRIAAHSKASLDTKAQKAAHSKSLIWEPRVAATQSYQTLYATCIKGFEELCQLDARFAHFQHTIFSVESQNQDRAQLTASENEELDRQTEAFLRLAGSRLRLMPAIKAIEWLIRRFRIHEENTEVLLLTFLPYHSITAFVTLLSILPPRLPAHFRFLDPYIRALQSPPRSIFIHQAVQHPEFLSTVSEYTLESCRVQYQYPALITFWGGFMTEAASGLIDRNKSGRSAIQSENDQALLHRLGPILAESLTMKKVPSMQIASYMALAVFVSKANLEDVAVTAFMEQTVYGWTSETVHLGLICLAIMAQQRSAKQMSGKVTRALMKVPDVGAQLVEIGQERRVDKLANGLCLALIERFTKKGDSRGLPTIMALLNSNILKDRQIAVNFKSLLLTALKLDTTSDADGALRRELGSALITLSQISGKPGDIIQSVIADSEFDIEELEMKLDLFFRARKIEQPSQGEGAAPASDAAEPTPADITKAVEDISKRKAKLSPCLVPQPNEIFDEFSHLFFTVVSEHSRESALLAKLEQSSILRQSSAIDDPTYLSFMVRVWCGPYPALARAAALDAAKRRLKADDFAHVDLQALVPYCIAALRDPSKRVRQSAADMVAVISNLHPLSKPKFKKTWGKSLYGQSNDFDVTDPEVIAKMLHLQLLPGIEECVMDPAHISELVRSAVESGKFQAPARADLGKKGHMSQAGRLAILSFLATHAVSTPIITVRQRLLQTVNGITKVSGTSRTQLLLPILSWWTRVPKAEAVEICNREKLDKSLLDKDIAAIITPNDASGLEFAVRTLEAPAPKVSPEIFEAILARLHQVWSAMKDDRKFPIAENLLNISQKVALDESLESIISADAADFLRKVPLTTDILLLFLNAVHTGTKMITEPPPNKRRRTSAADSNRSFISQATPELSQALRKVTFVLQIVDNSEPVAHPELLDGLFTTLAELQHFRTVVGSELGYLQNLILRSILAMMPAYRDNPDLKIDSSGGYGDLLVNCIQKSSSPVVQNAALLLIGSLASTAPNLVLHSVMPIFTFMGTSVLRQSDDYSAHVVSQTIKEVVPPLMDALRRGQKNVLAGASDILVSFTTAFEHIPAHRRQTLFVALIETLGPDDFLSALIAMLVDRYGSSDVILEFVLGLLDHFSTTSQLQALDKIMDIVADLFKPKPAEALGIVGLFEEGEDKDTEQLALRQMQAFPNLLANKKLKSQIQRMADRDDMDAAQARELYASLLEKTLILADTVKDNKTLHARCGASLANLLGLLSIGEYIKAVENLLDRPDQGLRQKVLRSLEIRVEGESNTDASSRKALLAFLPQLTAAIRDSVDIRYKHTAVTCVDKIAEKYGKKDIEAVVAAAMTIAGEHCLGQSERRLRVMALLCLTSLVDVLRDAVLPVLPIAIPKTLAYLNESLQSDEADEELHSASYSFLSSLAEHLPYMLSTHVGPILEVSNTSAEAGLGKEAVDSRVSCIHFLARQLDAKEMLSGLENNWSSASSAGFNAVGEYLDVLGLCIDKHAKSAIAKNKTTLTKIILNGFDLRRQMYGKEQKLGSDELVQLEKIESSVNEKALKMIYKLNDAAFRPIFMQFVEWASEGLPKKDHQGLALRRYTVYGFFETFFGNLKSIVTNYATYIVDDAVQILTKADVKSQTGQQLWRRVLRMLAVCFEHDQDDFWQAPAHFSAVAPAITSQFLHAEKIDVVEDLIPAVVELGAAADSQAHQKEVNSALMQHMRSEVTQVRLAAVKCEQALTDRLGEEWLSMLHEMLPRISELQEDDDEEVERETHRWIVKIEDVLGESLDAMLQ